MNKNLKSNPQKLYLYKFINSISLTSGVWVLYMSFKGLTLTQIGIEEAIFHISSFLFEIPSGAIADIYGRKKTLVLAGISSIISCLIMLFSTNVIHFAFAMVFSALSYNLRSGSEEALAFDTLKELKKENTFIKFNSNLNIIIEIASSIGTIIGGFIASISYYYVYIVDIFISIFSSFNASLLVEPQIRTKSENKFSIKTMCFELKKQILDSITIIKQNKNIAFIMVFDATISTMCTTLYFYYQKHLELQGFSIKMIGVILMLVGVFGIIGSKLSSSIERLIAKQKLIIFLSTGMSISIMVSAIKFNIIAIIGFGFISFINSISFPIISNYINQRIPSEQRATIISVGSMIFSFIMILLFPLIGKLCDIFGTTYAFILMSVILLIFTTILLLSFIIKKYEI